MEGRSDKELTAFEKSELRQKIILLLLRRVCSFVDPTPHTFLHKCHKMFHLGILTSLSFLEDPGFGKLCERSNVLDDTEAQDLWQVLTSSVLTVPSTSSRVRKPIISLSRFQTDFDDVTLLNRGAFGIVYSAHHRLDDITYAIKCVRFSHTGKMALLQQKVFSEVKILAKLEHPNVCRYTNAWIEPAWSKPNIANEPHPQDDYFPDDADCTFNLSVPSLSDSEDDHDESAAESSSSNASGVDDVALELQREFPKEAVHFSKLNYANMAQEAAKLVFDVELFIQMELCSPLTLKDMIDDQCREISLDIVIPFFIQLVSGLAHVHERGVLHRDLKPSNILLRRRRNADPASAAWTDFDLCIADFGLSKLFATSSAGSSVLDGQIVSHAGDVSDHTDGLGTTTYASPEQISRRDYDDKTDIYSTGIILFELLNNFSTQMERVIAIQRLRDNGAIPVEFKQRFPDAAALIGKLTTHDPLQRPNANAILQMQFIERFRSESSSVATNTELELVPRKKGLGQDFAVDKWSNDYDKDKIIMNQARIIQQLQQEIEMLKAKLNLTDNA